MAGATIKYNIHDWDSADAVLGKRDRKKIGNRTYLIREEGHVIAVLYCATKIAYFHHTWVQFFTGGYTTYTTKDRMNQLIPVPWSIYQRQRKWYVRNHQTDEVLVWQDGITFLTN